MGAGPHAGRGPWARPHTRPSVGRALARPPWRLMLSGGSTMAKKKKRRERPRTVRRRRERALDALGDARERLAALSAGGAADRPLDVDSASVVELVAARLGCARCDGAVRVLRHDAVDGLRRVHTRCTTCERTREVWLRLAPRLLS